jgi:hypothetical protein
MNLRPRVSWIVLLVAASCAATVPPPSSSRMVPAKLAGDTAVRISVYVEDVKLASIAQTRETPFEARSGRFPLTEPDGLVQLRDAIRKTLAAAGAALEPQPGAARFVLTPIILGGMTIPFPEAYAILFVRYELSRADGRQAVWANNVYSQARFDTRDVAGAQSGDAEATYGRLAAANLRQMATSLSNWLATTTK